MAISISGNGNSSAISLEDPTIFELRLRATSIDSGFEGVVQRADIGESNWRDVYIDSNIQKFTANVLEFLALGDAQYRITVTGFGETDTMTLDAVPIVQNVNVSTLDPAAVAAIAAIATPGTSPDDDEPGATRWEAYTGETITKTVTVYAADGTTPVDLSGETLELVFETESDTVVATVANGSITVSGDNSNVVTFDYPAAVTARETVLVWSLRQDDTPSRVFLNGTLRVKRSAVGS